ncbi:alpha/beta hydrolase [Nitrosophilus labii]|uniref:alpha/beta hydrolase n=1 Tax=Nitrosophilus labii TaxID=2706014 RepID=UPI0016576552|nr:alpha/beta fold hydrolase [Nitrosophilus labii]
MEYLAATIFILYIAIVLKLYYEQDKKIFHPEKAPKNIFLDVENLENITFTTSDSVSLEGAFVNNAEYNPLVIYFGGNSNNALYFLNLVKEFNDYNFLVFNYRGFANSKGKPSQETLFLDALEIYDNFAKEKDVYLVGRSLGSSVATYLGSKRDIKGLVLITPFDSILEIAKKKHKYLPISSILKHRFETIEYIKKVHVPVALIEVENEEVIPKENIHNLKKEIKNLQFKEVLKGTTHMAVFMHPDFKPILKKALDTLRGLA